MVNSFCPKWGCLYFPVCVYVASTSSVRVCFFYVRCAYWLLLYFRCAWVASTSGVRVGLFLLPVCVCVAPTSGVRVGCFYFRYVWMVFSGPQSGSYVRKSDGLSYGLSYGLSDGVSVDKQRKTQFLV
jgi:hypothetical protein